MSLVAAVFFVASLMNWNVRPLEPGDSLGDQIVAGPAGTGASAVHDLSLGEAKQAERKQRDDVTARNKKRAEEAARAALEEERKRKAADDERMALEQQHKQAARAEPKESPKETPPVTEPSDSQPKL